MLILFLCCALAACSLSGLLYSRFWSRHLETDITFSDQTAYAGDTLKLEEVITNRKRLPLPRLEVSFRIPKGLRFVDAENTVVSDYVYKRDIFSLRSMEMITRRYLVLCEHRGRYGVSQVELLTQPLLGKPSRLSAGGPKTLSGDAAGPAGTPLPQLLVYAGHTDVSGIEKLCDQLLGEQESRRSLYEDPFLFNGIRAYEPTDPIKYINWKAMARTGELMVNTFASVRSVSLMIYLDVSDEKILKEDVLVEEGIRAAASLIRQQISRSQPAGLAINTNPPVRFEPGRGTDLLSKIEYALTADFKSEDTLPFVRLFEDEPVSPASPVIRVLISKNMRDHELEALPFRAVVVIPTLKDGAPATAVRLSGSGR